MMRRNYELYNSEIFQYEFWSFYSFETNRSRHTIRCRGNSNIHIPNLQRCHTYAPTGEKLFDFKVIRALSPWNTNIREAAKRALPVIVRRFHPLEIVTRDGRRDEGWGGEGVIGISRGTRLRGKTVLPAPDNRFQLAKLPHQRTFLVSTFCAEEPGEFHFRAPPPSCRPSILIGEIPGMPPRWSRLVVALPLLFLLLVRDSPKFPWNRN